MTISRKVHLLVVRTKSLVRLGGKTMKSLVLKVMVEQCNLLRERLPGVEDIIISSIKWLHRIPFVRERVLGVGEMIIFNVKRLSKTFSLRER